jgi:hypothetical protein
VATKSGRCAVVDLRLGIERVGVLGSLYLGREAKNDLDLLLLLPRYCDSISPHTARKV